MSKYPVTRNANEMAVCDPAFGDKPMKMIGGTIKCPCCGAENRFDEDIETVHTERIWRTEHYDPLIVETNVCKKCGAIFKTEWSIEFNCHIIDKKYEDENKKATELWHNYWAETEKRWGAEEDWWQKNEVGVQYFTGGGMWRFQPKKGDEDNGSKVYPTEKNRS